MWQRFTEGTRHAIVRAQQAATQRSENLVKPEHLLIGLLADTHTVAYRLLQESGIAVSELTAHLEDILTPGPGRDDTDLRLDPAAKKVIDLAWNEARRQRRQFIGTEHLILGILAADSGATGITFRHFSLSLEKARALMKNGANFYAAEPALLDTGLGLAVASRQSEAEASEIDRHRKELLPGQWLGIVFTMLMLLTLMLRGCG